VMQLLSFKRIEGKEPGGSVRYRLVLSDGVQYVQGVLTQELNHLVDTQQLRRDCVVSIRGYSMSEVLSRK
jgi:replication factor A1